MTTLASFTFRVEYNGQGIESGLLASKLPIMTISSGFFHQEPSYEPIALYHVLNV